jgi:hypothetical protein
VCETPTIPERAKWDPELPSMLNYEFFGLASMNDELPDWLKFRLVTVKA